MQQKAWFMTIEGIEGVGKTTQVQLLSQALQKASIPHRLTREPGGTQLGNQIRHWLLHATVKVDVKAELLLLFAARAQHLTEVIYPTLKAGIHVISDRFTDASYAYQGAGRGLSLAFIRDLEQGLQGDFRPDYTIILDADPEWGLEKAQDRGALDKIEQEGLEFMKRVRAGYIERASIMPERYALISARQSISAVHEAILQAVLKKFDLKFT